MILDATPFARRNGSVLELRSGPVRLRWELDGLLCSDGHSLRLTFAAAVGPLDAPTERKMLQESLLADRAQIGSRDVVAYFQPSLREAAERYASTRPVSDLLADAGRLALRDALIASARAVAFNCGVEIVPPIELEAQSPSLRQQQAEASARQQADQRTARHVADLRQTAELYKEFQALRESSPLLTDGQALARFATTDQADLLKSLLMSSAGPASDCLWAAAGSALVRISHIDGSSGPPATELVLVSDRLGPLRSVQWARLDGRNVILAGARTGIWIIDPQYAADAQPFENPGMTSILGFNRARLVDGMLLASHGEMGLVSWDLSNPAQPRWVAAPVAGAAPRFLLSGNDVAVFYAGGRSLMSVDRAGQCQAIVANGPADIVGLVAGENHLAVVYGDGAVCLLDRHNPGLSGHSSWTRPAGVIIAAGRLPWLSSSRLLLATEDGPVLCLGFDDPVCTQYRSAHRGLRMVAGSAGGVAAVSADRQRLIFWNSWEPARPAADIHLGAVARHRIADLAFVPTSV
jgi:hypothetical protein